MTYYLCQKKFKMETETEKINQGLKLLAKSSIIVFIGIVISKLTLYFYRAIIARYFGPEYYGLFSLALLVLNLAVAISILGLSEGIVRYVTIYRGKNQFKKIDYIFKIPAIIILFVSIISSIILFFSSGIISQRMFHNTDLVIFLKISSIIIPFYTFSNLFLAFIRAFEKISIYSFILNILQNVVKVIALIILIAIGIKSNSIMLSFFIGVFLMFAFSYYFCRKYLSETIDKNELEEKEKTKVLKDLFYYSLPLMFSNILYTVYSMTDSFVIGYFKGVTDVGLYNAAIPIALLISIIPDFFIQLFYPLITKEYSKENFKVVQEISKQVSKWIFIITLPVFLLMFIFPGAFINIFFGKEYLVSSNSLRILAFGSFIYVFSSLWTTILMMAGKSKTILTNFIVASIINLLLNVILVIRYGIIGAAIATSIVWIGLSLALLIEVKKSVNFLPLRKKMIRVIIVSLIPLAILLIVRSFIVINFISLVILGIFFFLVYFFTIFITGCFDKNDIFILKAFKDKIFSFNPSKNVKN
jgi:O-antigen/teichoic acid export membrane protein